MYSAASSYKQGTNTLLNRWGSDEGEGRRSECPPGPTTTLRSNLSSHIVETRRTSGMPEVRLHPSAFRPEGIVGRSQCEVVPPKTVSRSSRAATATSTVSAVDDPSMFDDKASDKKSYFRKWRSSWGHDWWWCETGWTSCYLHIWHPTWGYVWWGGKNKRSRRYSRSPHFYE